MRYRCSKRKYCLLLLTLICVGALQGCGKSTKRQLAEPFREQVEDLKVELAALALEIPSAEPFNKVELPLEPKPYYHIADELSNTTVMSFYDLIGSNVVNREDIFSLYAAGIIEETFSEIYDSQPASPRFLDGVKATIDLRYVIVYQTPGFRDALLVSETVKENHENVDGFSQGQLNLIVSLYDRQRKAWVLSQHFEIDPPEQLEVTGTNGTYEQRLQSAGRAYFRGRVEKLIVNLIESTVGGRIEFDSRAFRKDGTQLENFTY